jgi:hypothetical protein
MPNFHLPLVRELKDVKLGSLISLQYFYQSQSSIHLGIRLGYQGSQGIAVLAFGADAKGKRTTFVCREDFCRTMKTFIPTCPFSITGTNG